MEDLLYLVHRFPYPPRKGDKVRSYHLLKYLSSRYRVHLGAFVDDRRDWSYRPELEKLCAGTCFLPLHPGRKRWRSLTGLARKRALTLPYYRDAALQAWVDGVMREYGPRRILVFSTGMAQYVTPYLGPGIRAVLDMVDVDSDKWRQYGERMGRMAGWVYRREARYLLEFEREMSARFDASVFVSREEAELFRSLSPETAGRIDYINNGVDCEYFSPDAEYPNPYGGGERVLVFTGAMDYWANADAVRWFAREVFPAIRSGHPDVCFYIVGARPTPGVRALSKLRGVRVTGTVDDVRPYIAWASLCVAPLRVARGVQNKVLEALAMGKPVLATPAATEGLEKIPGLDHRVAADAEGLMKLATRWLTKEAAGWSGRAAREYVLEHYDWSRNLRRIGDLLEGDAPGAEQDSGARAELLPEAGARR